MNFRKTGLRQLLPLFCLILASAAARAQLQPSTLRGKPFNNITLEASLKPFKKNDKTYIREVAKEMFVQWHALLRHADTVSVMLWTGDGSEILEYEGTPSQPMEWARYIGNPNTKHAVNSGPKELSIHERAYFYLENPPQFTYGDLKFIVETLKEEGRKVTGKPIRVGETFDPGPEFAKSDFKYKRHTEILGGSAMGHNTMVSCYSVLKADKDPYAGFPNGIPEGTPFGTFLGKQSNKFLKDMGFDFLWLSNGFGFGVEGWSSTGAIFDGKGFDQAKLAATKSKISDFWKFSEQNVRTFRSRPGEPTFPQAPTSHVTGWISGRSTKTKTYCRRLTLPGLPSTGTLVWKWWATCQEWLSCPMNVIFSATIPTIRGGSTAPGSTATDVSRMIFTCPCPCPGSMPKERPSCRRT